MLNFGLSNNTLTKKGADLKSVPLNLHVLSYRKRFSHRNYRSHDFFYTYSYLHYRDMN